LFGDYSNAICEGLAAAEDENKPEALYRLGLSYLKVGDYAKARNNFRTIIKKFRASQFYQPALVKLADAYFLEKDLEKARSLYLDLLSKNLTSTFQPLIYLRLAQIAGKQGAWDEEKKYVEIIKEEHPRTIESKYAQILEKRGYFFTIQVGAFSQRKNALTLLNELKAKYPTYLVRERFDDITLYKVRIGKFKERGYVEKIKRSLIKDGYASRIYP
jgi:outer membrane protein assembly factor BamD (BamD/ComL family)